MFSVPYTNPTPMSIFLYDIFLQLNVTVETAHVIISDLNSLVSQVSEAVDQSQGNLDIIATILLEIRVLIVTQNFSTDVNVRKCSYDIIGLRWLYNIGECGSYHVNV